MPSKSSINPNGRAIDASTAVALCTGSDKADESLSSIQEQPAPTGASITNLRGAFRLAERWFRRAVALRPSDATDYIFLGALLAIAGRLSEAEAVHRRATKCKEGCRDEAYLNLGLVLRALGRWRSAPLLSAGTRD